MNAPDGMAEMRHRELQNMKAARQEPGFTHDVVAVDIDGNVLYETESFYSAEEASAALSEYDVSKADEEVDAFTVRKR